MAQSDQSSRHKPRRYMTALVLGTALSTLGMMPAEANARTAVQDLSRYCTVCWRNARLQPDCWPDCTQEVLARLVERVHPERWPHILQKETEERREFLRAIDAVKKRSLRARRTVPLVAEVADQPAQREPSVEEQRQWVLKVSRENLSPRQSYIITQSLAGASVAEIAEDLDLSPVRVSDEKYKAIRKLQQLLT
jgi:RNA polymerase sigma factor (sigma-70 family)